MSDQGPDLEDGKRPPNLSSGSAEKLRFRGWVIVLLAIVGWAVIAVIIGFFSKRS